MKFIKKHRFKLLIAIIFLAAAGLIVSIKVQKKYEANPGLMPPSKNYDITVELTPEKEMEYQTNVMDYDKKIKDFVPSTGEKEIYLGNGIYGTAETSSTPDEERFIQKSENLKKLGKYTEAIRTMNEMFKRHQESTVGRHNLGVIYEELGELKKAIMNYQKIVEVDGDRGGQYSKAIAGIYVQLGKGQEAGQRYIKYEQNGGARDTKLMGQIKDLND